MANQAKIEQLKKVLTKASNLEKGGEIALAQEFISIDDKIELLTEELKKKDYITTELKGEQGERGTPGEGGKDYVLTSEDKREIAGAIKVPIVEKVIEKTETIIEQPIITNEIKEVAIAETPLQIKDKLETLKKDERLDKKAIKGLEDYIDQKKLDFALGVLDSRTKFLINKATPASSGGGTWGSITGTLSDQTDLQTVLDTIPSYGTTTQIPYMNAGGTDFDYSSNFVFTGTKFNLTGADLSEVSNITSNIATTINNRTVRILTNNNQTSGSGTATGGLFVQVIDNGITTGGAAMATLGMQFSVSRSTTFNNSGIAGTLRAVQGTVSDQGIYSRASTQTVTQDAFQGTLTHSPTITGGQSLTHTVSALNVNFAGDAIVTSGSWTANVYGVRFTGGGAVAGTTTYRAFYNSAGSYDTNWTFYNDTANNNFLGYDNSKTYFGTGADASIYYDGTNMYVNPKEVGTGALVLSGDVGVGVIPRTALDVTGNIITSWADNFIGIQYQTGTAYKMGLTADTALRTLVIGTYSGDGTGEIIFKTGTVASPTEKVRIQYDGKVAINKTSTANSMLDIEDTGTTFYPSANIYRNSTNAPAYSSAIYGRFSTNQTSASFTGEQVALTGEMWLSGNQNWTGNGLQGASGAIGVLGRVEHRSGTFSIANASGFISQAEVATNGTITKFTGYRALNPTGSGTLTNNYGFYVNTLSKGSTSNWAFYAETNPSYFGGGVVERVVTTTDDATAVIDVAVTDTYELSAIANATTFSTTGTPTDGQEILIRFKDAGVAKGLTWDAIFVEIGQTLPIITIAGKWHYVGVKYNSSASKFHVLAVSVQT